ncbi:metallophosphoesterase MPPED2-like [Mytilus trossulus]|uniref:metallophosphoesterase MPPED2-like n=1 Tax=Mytilus trossulus TaxID=6551 RepID=UPI0030066A63
MLNSLKNMIFGNEKSEESADGPVIIQVDSMSKNSNKAWDKMKVKQNQMKVKHMDPKTPITEDKIRFVCISDTHSKIEYCPKDFVPDGDVLLHAGDITNVGHPKEIKQFNDYLATLPHKHKVLIAGNHDLTFDDSMEEKLNRWHIKKEKVKEFLEKNGVKKVKELLTDCVYLEDSMVTLYGINIYGSPWQPWFGDWGFNLERGEEMLEKWNWIPEKTDILITHSPPIGYGDLCFDGCRAGCVELLNTIQKRVKPLYHISGHIHEGYGVTSDGFTTYINASTCTLRYKADNQPIVFDFPIPEGHSKQEVIDLTVTQFGTQDNKTTKTDSDDDLVEFKEDEEDPVKYCA